LNTKATLTGFKEFLLQGKSLVPDKTARPRKTRQGVFGRAIGLEPEAVTLASQHDLIYVFGLWTRQVKLGLEGIAFPISMCTWSS